MNFKIGKLEFFYDEKQRAGSVTTGSKTIVSQNALELLNVFMNEIEGPIKRKVQDKLETAGINKYTGIPVNENEISSC